MNHPLDLTDEGLFMDLASMAAAERKNLCFDMTTSTRTSSKSNQAEDRRLRNAWFDRLHEKTFV